MYVHLYVYMYVYTYVRTYVRTYVCMYVSMYVRTYAYIDVWYMRAYVLYSYNEGQRDALFLKFI